MPHAALCVVQLEIIESLEFDLEVSMPHAALCVVQQDFACEWVRDRLGVSMPHAALCVVQPGAISRNEAAVVVSMPHAALCVVQPAPPVR